MRCIPIILFLLLYNQNITNAQNFNVNYNDYFMKVSLDVDDFDDVDDDDDDDDELPDFPVVNRTLIIDNRTEYATCSASRDRPRCDADNIIVGKSNTGIFNVINNKSAYASGYIILGENAGSNGIVNVEDTGSFIEFSDLFIIGKEGNGTLNISKGGSASDYSSESIDGRHRIIIGDRSTGEGAVYISGIKSNLTNYIGDTVVGLNGRAAINVSDSGSLIAGNSLSIAEGSGSIGTVRLTDPGTTLVAGNIHIGQKGTASLTLSDGAMVKVSDGNGIINLGAQTISTAGSSSQLNFGSAHGQSPANPGFLSAKEIRLGYGDNSINFNHIGQFKLKAKLSDAGAGSHTINHYAGNTTFTADNSKFTGTTNIYDGKLYLGNEDGNTDNLNILGGKVNVLSGGTLGGYGAFSGIVDVDGTLSIGDNGGSLVFLDQLNLKATSKAIFDFNNMGSLNPDDNAQDTAVFVDQLNIDGASLETRVAGAGIYILFLYNSPSYGTQFSDETVVSTKPDFDIGSASVGYDIPQSIYLKVLGAGQTMQFWDGTQMSGSGNATGGDGIWNAVNTNWVDDFVITAHDVWGESVGVFAGHKGTVSVEGTQTFDTLNFITDGYQIVDGELALKGASGSTLNIATSVATTISSRIVDGASDTLNIIGSGKVILTNDNTYTGETQLLGGVLSVSRDSNLGAPSATLRFDGGTLFATTDMDLNRPVIFDDGNGAIAVEENDTLTTLTSFTGTGGFVKRGLGTLKIAAEGNYSGETIIRSGTVTVTGENLLSQASAFTIEDGGTLALQNYDQTLSSLTNGGLTDMGVTPGTTLTINGNYIGNNGIIRMRTVLSDDNSITDRLVINGNSEGFTTLAVENAGGTGTYTVEGIKLVDVKQNSNGVFRLQGNYEHEGEQAVVIGAYAYKLHKNGISDASDGDWYLRSLRDDPNPQPLYQAGAPVYEAYGQSLLALNSFSTLQERNGNRVWAGNGNRTIIQGADSVDSAYAAIEEAGNHTEGNGIWGRIEGAHNHIKPHVSGSEVNFNQNIYKVQIGIDGMLQQNNTGKLIGGLTFQYASAETRVYSASGDGTINTDGYRVGTSLTWYHDEGYYADAQAQFSWYRSNLKSDMIVADLARDNHGTGYAFSIEGGKRIALDDPSWSFTPQAQLIYSAISFDDFTDSFGSRAKLERGDSLHSRFGLALAHENAWQNSQGMTNRTHIYGLTNLYYEFLNGTKVDLEQTSLANAKDRFWAGVGLGGTYNWNDDKFSIYGEGVYNTSFNSFADSYMIKGQVGFKVKW